MGPKHKRSLEQLEITYSTLNILRAQETTCDIYLICGDLRIPAHRLVLRASSAYFAAMFTSGLKEASSLEVKLPTISATSMTRLLDFLYFQDVDVGSLSVDETWDLLSTAHLMQVFPLVEMCSEELIKKITCDNWDIMLREATKYSLECFVLTLVQYLSEFEKWSDNRSLQNLEFESLRSLISTSTKDNCHSADALLNLILTWVMYDAEKRKEHLLDLFQAIDISSISEETLTSLVNDNDLVKNSLELCRLLLGRLATDKSAIKTAITDPKLLILKQSCVHSFDLRKRIWSVHNLPANTRTKVHYPIAVNDTTIYFTAEYFDSHEYHGINKTHIMAYNPLANICSMIIRYSERYDFSMAYLNESLYFTGARGYFIPDDSSYLESYNVNLKTWQQHTKPNKCLRHPEMITFKSYLYVVGDTADKTHIEKYCPTTDQWTDLNPLPDCFSDYNAACLCQSLETIFVGFGVKDNSSNEVFHSRLYKFKLEECSWKEVTNEFKPILGDSDWFLCDSVKNLPFLPILQHSKYYRVDLRTMRKVLITPREENVEKDGIVVIFA